MQVQNVTLNNSYSQKKNPNFTAIKSVKCEGLYKKYPEYANELVEAFKQNPKAMEFCKKYDVDIVFYAVKQMQDNVKSSILIFFDNVSKSRAKRFFDKLFGNNEDKVVLHAWGNKYSLQKSLKSSTEELVNNIILPERKIEGHYRGGLLNAHLESADEKIQKVLSEKARKVQQKEAKLAAKKEAEDKLQNAGSKLQDSINDLIEKGL